MPTKQTLPKISVILPAYNAEMYIEEAVRSILAQTEPAFELLAFDDGSTDNTLEILERFASRDERVILTSRPNRGLCNVLQDGVNRARGEFIARMDADDSSIPTRFEQQLRFLQHNPTCVAVGSRVIRVDPDGDPLALSQVSTRHALIDNELLNNLPGKICHPTVMMRADAVRKVGGYQQAYHFEDVDLFLRLAEIGQLANIESPLLRYRLHPASICHTREQVRIRQIYAEIAEASRRRRGLPSSPPGGLPRTPMTAAIKSGNGDTSLLDAVCRWSALAREGGYHKTAWKHAKHAIRLAPTNGRSWWTVSNCLLGSKATRAIFAPLCMLKQMTKRHGTEKDPSAHRGERGSHL